MKKWRRGWVNCDIFRHVSSLGVTHVRGGERQGKRADRQDDVSWQWDGFFCEEGEESSSRRLRTCRPKTRQSPAEVKELLQDREPSRQQQRTVAAAAAAATSCLAESHTSCKLQQVVFVFFLPFVLVTPFDYSTPKS